MSTRPLRPGRAWVTSFSLPRSRCLWVERGSRPEASFLSHLAVVPCFSDPGLLHAFSLPLSSPTDTNLQATTRKRRRVLPLFPTHLQRLSSLSPRKCPPPSLLPSPPLRLLDSSLVPTLSRCDSSMTQTTTSLIPKPHQGKLLTRQSRRGLSPRNPSVTGAECRGRGQANRQSKGL